MAVRKLSAPVKLYVFRAFSTLLGYPPPSEQMHDEGDERDDEQQMDRTTGDVESSPHDQPQHEQSGEENQEYKIS
jgi:hypothetical protein